MEARNLVDLGGEDDLMDAWFEFGESLEGVKEENKEKNEIEEIALKREGEEEKDHLVSEGDPLSFLDKENSLTQQWFYWSYSKQINTYVDSYTGEIIPQSNVLSVGRLLESKDGRQLVNVKNFLNRQYWFLDNYEPILKNKNGFITYSYEKCVLQIENRPVIAGTHLVYFSGNKVGQLAPNNLSIMTYQNRYKSIDGEHVVRFSNYLNRVNGKIRQNKRSKSTTESFSYTKASEASSPVLFSRKRSQPVRQVQQKKRQKTEVDPSSTLPRPK